MRTPPQKDCPAHTEMEEPLLDGDVSGMDNNSNPNVTADEEKRHAEENKGLSSMVTQAAIPDPQPSEHITSSMQTEPGRSPRDCTDEAATPVEVRSSRRCGCK